MLHNCQLKSLRKHLITKLIPDKSFSLHAHMPDSPYLPLFGINQTSFSHLIFTRNHQDRVVVDWRNVSLSSRLPFRNEKNAIK